MVEVISLVEMNVGKTGTVIEMHGGHGMERNLEGMGIRIGSRIKKISQQIMNGPVVLSYGNTHVAVGHGMAKRLMVEVDQ